MKKEFNLLRIKILLCSVLAILLLSPTILNAQRTDNFFSEYEDIYDNRQLVSDLSTVNLGGFLDEDPIVPVGSGLLVMVVAGAGYAISRRKRSFRKATTLLLAIVLMLGLTQCKKKVVAPVNNNGEKINITLNAGYGDGRTVFDPNNCFSWTAGIREYIYVGGSARSGLKGTLSGVTNEPNAKTISISGEISNEFGDGETLYFFYLGKGIRRYDYPSLAICFAEQTGELNDVTDFHVAVGSAPWVKYQTEYNANLEMAMAIAYFDLSGFGNEEVRIYGEDLYTIAEVDYQHGRLVGKAKGSIKTKAVAGGNYIALIPSTTEQTTLKFVSNTRKGELTFYRGIQAKRFYSSGGSPLEVTTTEYTVGTDGLLSGLFTVSGSGGSAKKVKFSQGNLQYIGSAAKPYWSFAEHQYDYLGTTVSQNSNLENVDRDLFGWATSGYHRGIDSVNCRNYPFSTEKDGIGYSDAERVYVPYGAEYPGYGPTRISVSHGYPMRFQIEPSYFGGASMEYDWGVHNAIKNGGDIPGLWRTLTRNEWVWLVGPPSSINPGKNCRLSSTVNGVANARYVAATVNSVHGIIIFPDSYSHPSDVTQPVNINIRTSSWSSNVYNDGDWTKMESAGCVFLPAAGYRDVTTVNSINDYGWYWLGDTEAYSTARCFNFADRFILPGNTGNTYYKNRYYGCSVRLVRDAN